MEVEYIEASEDIADIRQLLPKLNQHGIDKIHHLDIVDDWLRQRLTQSANAADIELFQHDSPLFLNTCEEIKNYFEEQDSYHQTDFYIDQRKKRGILINDEDKPIGGKWSFDPENRSKYPKDKIPPALQFPEKNDYHQKAKSYVESHFNHNYGELNDTVRYPVTFEQTRHWLDDFLHERFKKFGDYQDVIVQEECFLNHSILTPMLNVGLITPGQVLYRALD